MNLRSLSLKMASLAFPLLFGASGCHTYKYVDINVSFDPATGFDDAAVLSINDCRILVTGEDTDSFILAKCPNRAAVNPLEVGVFEYSTFADSGTLSFELKAFQNLGDRPECQVGDGKTSIKVTGLTTLTGDLVVAKTGNGCANVTPPTDGGM